MPDPTPARGKGTEVTLEPQLTRFDLRVFNALADHPRVQNTYWDGEMARPEYRSAWQIAERLREYDVAAVRDTLRGLVHLGYAWDRSWGHKQQWIKAWRPNDDRKESAAALHGTQGKDQR